MKGKISTILAIISLLLLMTDADKPCIPRKYNHDSVVCVCNSTYCDEISKVRVLKPGNYVLYTSTQEGERFNRSYGEMHEDHGVVIQLLSHTVFHIKRKQTYQKIMGFGGSITDSASINILNLSKAAQRKLINSYFSKTGLEYNMIRVPIGGTDFSTRNYMYNELPEYDFKLTNFSLAYEDLIYKIPMIKRAQAASENKIHLMASSWDSPHWMKKDSFWAFTTHLRGDCYQTWADYHLKFLEEYDKRNVLFDSITLGNEAGTGILPPEILKITNYLGWTPQDQAIWLGENLGPTIRNSKYKKILILALDDQRYFLPFWIVLMATTNDALNYVDGIAVHWYANKNSPISVIQYMHNFFGDKFIISNEASISGMVKESWDTEIVQLGAWDKAEKYVSDIIECLNNWYVGWLDWNLALDMEGGPNWSNNFVDASVIVNKETDEFYKQPLYYAVGHFSKFIPKGSIRIQINSNWDDLPNVAFLRKDGGVTVVMYNRENYRKTVIIQEVGKGHIELTLKPKSFNTLIYW